MATASGTRLTREEFRKAKELEELRKTGAAPPELDATGKIINPHIPEFMARAPWYYHTEQPGLQHQYHSQYKKRKASPNANESAESTAAEESSSSYDGKRDRWNNYDPADYDRVVKLYEKVEEERKKKKVDDDLTDSGAMIQQLDSTNRITVRNLRIREDTAKYLHNLNLSSAHYDPKSRSMRESPFESASADKVIFAGDNFIRASGEAKKVRDLEQFVWNLHDQLEDNDLPNGSESENKETNAVDSKATEVLAEVHPIALPSVAEKLFRAHLERSTQLKEEKRSAITAKYGNIAKNAKEILL